MTSDVEQLRSQLARAEERLAAKTAECDDLSAQVEELEEGLSNAQENVAAEFEKDNTRVVRQLLNKTDFPFQEYEPEGWTAENAADHLHEHLNDVEARLTSMTERADKAEDALERQAKRFDRELKEAQEHIIEEFDKDASNVLKTIIEETEYEIDPHEGWNPQDVLEHIRECFSASDDIIKNLTERADKAEKERDRLRESVEELLPLAEAYLCIVPDRLPERDNSQIKKLERARASLSHGGKE